MRGIILQAATSGSHSNDRLGELLRSLDGRENEFFLCAAETFAILRCSRRCIDEHRCVITGRDATGKSVVARDELVPPKSILGYEFHRLWGSDGSPTLPNDGRTPVPRMYFPLPGGYRFGYFVMPPNSDAIPPEQFLAALPQMQEMVPGLADVLEAEHPGMHTSDTVDFDVVLSGEVWLEQDDGKQVLLQAGECVVQNGTRHAWHNRSNEICVVAVCLLGARSVADGADLR